MNNIIIGEVCILKVFHSLYASDGTIPLLLADMMLLILKLAILGWYQYTLPQREY